MKAARLLALHQRGNVLTQDVKNLQPHEHGLLQTVGNDRRGIERIGIILPQVELRRLDSRSRQGPQRQGKGAGLIGGGSHPRAQIAQIEQSHLGTSDRLARGQPHLPGHHSLSPYRHTQQGAQDEETTDQALNGQEFLRRGILGEHRNSPLL